jgi:hypothetical protein
MPFKKGQSGNPAGRKAGSENKTTRDIRYIINKILDNVSDMDIKDILTEIKAEKPEALLSFLGKIAPKKLTVDGEIKNKLLEKLDSYDQGNTDISNS